MKSGEQKEIALTLLCTVRLFRRASMYQSILVPLDGSSFGEQALPLAMKIAQKANANLEVIHVHETLSPLYSQPLVGMETGFDKEIRAHRAAYVDRIVKRVKSESKVPVVPRFLEGSVVQAILDQVSTKKNSLIVMTTHGHGPLARFWIGSVADELVRHAPAPILLVHPHEETQSKEPKIGKILVSLDGSSHSESMLEHAAELAGLMGAELLLVRVIQPLIMGNVPIPEPTVATVAPSAIAKLEGWYEQRRKEATDYLLKLAESLSSRSLKARTSVLVDEQPALAILNEAKKQGVDLIALETHGRGGLSRFFLGSVADKVIRGAQMPVLVHRSNA
jgi:nucleotide-binding universal stress UspA family protein